MAVAVQSGPSIETVCTCDGVPGSAFVGMEVEVGKPTSSRLLVIGAGPAGLTAAVESLKLGRRTIVVEKDAVVGGIARTESYKGFLFDMGGHRFFTKVAWVDRWWRDMLGEDFLRRQRLSRIYYNKKFFTYPPSFFNAIKGLGLIEGLRIVLSYLRSQLVPKRPVVSFADWVSNNFGTRLFEIFFKSYTEKVWGISCDELRAEWAAQRIKSMSLRTVLASMLVSPKAKVTSLIEAFDYPRRGPGMMWRTAAEHVQTAGGTLLLQSKVMRLRRQDNRICAAEIQTPEGLVAVEAEAYISSMSIPDLIRTLDPPPAAEILAAAAALRFRDFLTVCLIVDIPEVFPDNWIYVHSQDVRVARIQNFKNWSPDMSPDTQKTSLGLEYFCNEGDALWSTVDKDLVALAARELVATGLISTADVVTDGCVFRVPKAYPVYDSSYADALSTLRSFLDTITNLRTIGRNGLHRYNNQDHSMIAGRMAARQLLLGEEGDLWSINTEQSYLEQRNAGAELDRGDRDVRSVPA